MFPLIFIHNFICSLQNLICRNNIMSFREFYNTITETLRIITSTFPTKRFMYISKLFLHGLLRTVQKHNTKLITAKTHEQISRPDIFLHRLNEIQQVTIPFLMSEMIIHIF